MQEISEENLKLGEVVTLKVTDSDKFKVLATGEYQHLKTEKAKASVRTFLIGCVLPDNSLNAHEITLVLVLCKPL